MATTPAVTALDGWEGGRGRGEMTREMRDGGEELGRELTVGSIDDFSVKSVRNRGSK